MQRGAIHAPARVQPAASLAVFRSTGGRRRLPVGRPARRLQTGAQAGDSLRLQRENPARNVWLTNSAAWLALI